MTGFLLWWPCICDALCDFGLCLGFEELRRYWKVDRGEAGQFLGWRHSQVFMVIPSRRISMRSCLNIAYRDLFTRCSRTWSLRKQYSQLLLRLLQFAFWISKHCEDLFVFSSGASINEANCPSRWSVYQSLALCIDHLASYQQHLSIISTERGVLQCTSTIEDIL